MARFARVCGAFRTLPNCQSSNLKSVEPLLSLSCADDARRSAIADVLVRAGFELVDDLDLATLHILDDADVVMIRNNDETLIELSAPVSPQDFVALVRICLEVSTLWDVVRTFEDCESAGVIASHSAQDACSALAPVLFAAEALALSCPAFGDLTRMIVQGCNRAVHILGRITPAQRSAATMTCANTVITELLSTLRALSRRSKLVTRLESPLPPTTIERAELERMLLTLVAHATESRGSERIVVATWSRTIRTADPQGVPPGDWIVVEVEDDGVTMGGEIRDRALSPTFTPTPLEPSDGLGLPSIARITRSLGGHFSIEDRPRGTAVGIWLPRAE